MLGADRQACKQLASRDFKLLATDLSVDIIAAARAGRYSRETVKTVPEELRSAWMQIYGDKFEMRPEVRDLVAFRQLNLLKDWPMRQPFEAIFCRNVMIYFDEPTKARLQSRLADCLVPGGFLYIGHSERLAPEVAPRFRCIGRTIFQKVAQ
jgi:chemotaxis protein methyltransferase CheR